MRIENQTFFWILIVLFVISSINCQSDEDDIPSDEDNYPLRAVVDGNSKFAKKLYYLLKDVSPYGSFVFSPYSLSALLAMVRSGAYSKKKDEIQAALQMGALSDTILTEGFAELLQHYPIDNDDIEYKSLERIYVPDVHKIRINFKESIQEDYQAPTGIRSIDFAKTVTSADKMNTWMSQRTKGKIESIISPDSISKDTKLVLVSGVYFRGQWENAFTIIQQNPNVSTTDYFYLNGTHASSVTMMNQHGQFKYANLPDMRSEAVAIPFAGERLELIILLPKNHDGLEFPLEEKLKEGNLTFNSIVSQMKVRNINLFIPKFDTESFWTFTHSDKNSMLGKMGLSVDSTLRGLLDYNGITPYPGLFLDKIIHRTIISIRENGVQSPQDPPEETPKQESIVVRADHPFIFFIYDTDTKSILIMSRKAF